MFHIQEGHFKSPFPAVCLKEIIEVKTRYDDEVGHKMEDVRPFLAIYHQRESMLLKE